MDATNSREVQEPHPHDILTSECGRKIPPNHTGNISFLTQVIDECKKYESVSSPSESAQKVIGKIRSQTPPGRFLKRTAIRDHAGAVPPSLKSGWQEMSRAEATTAFESCFDKIKQVVDTKMQRKKRIQSTERSSREKKKSKSMSNRSENRDEINSAVIEIKSDESLCTDNSTGTHASDSSIPKSNMVSAVSFFIRRKPLCSCHAPNQYLSSILIFLPQRKQFCCFQPVGA